MRLRVEGETTVERHHWTAADRTGLLAARRVLQRPNVSGVLSVVV